MIEMIVQPNHTRASITARYNAGEKLEFVFFHGHATEETGELCANCLSQWYPSPFQIGGAAYRTAEQYMMAQKALLFQDFETYARILAAVSPEDHKSLGRGVRNFDPAVWEIRKYHIVATANLAKFSQNPEMRAYLLGTGEKILVEANPEDGIWGVKLAMDAPEIQNPNHWQGENLLGFALMEARAALRTQ